MRLVLSGTRILPTAIRGIMQYNRELMKSCIYGLAVGDALGLPFTNRERNTFSVSNMVSGGVHNQPAGTWSDDTSMALCILESITRKDTVDPEDIFNNFSLWFYGGKFACNGKVFDIGDTCRESIITGKAEYSELACGNGSLMRAAPLALVDCSNQDIIDVSMLTHNHKLPAYTCVSFCNILKKIIIYNNPTLSRYMLHTQYGFITHNSAINNSGYCVSTLEAALYCVANTSSYQHCVIKAVEMGGDADTIAAVAGAMAGVMYGFESIPRNWLEALQDKEVIENVLSLGL